MKQVSYEEMKAHEENTLLKYYEEETTASQDHPPCDKGRTTDTRGESYHLTRSSIESSNDRRRILIFLRDNPGQTRRGIALKLVLTINNVCGRVDELIKSGEIYEHGTTIDKQTNRKQKMLWQT